MILASRNDHIVSGIGINSIDNKKPAKIAGFFMVTIYF